MDKETIMQLLSDGVISNEVAAKYFPEIKESEDERIRKCVKYAIDKLFLKEKIVCDVRKDDVLAWLEKQGEQEATENSGKKSEDVTEEKDMTEYKKGFECGKQRVLKYPEDFGLCKSSAWSEEDEINYNYVLAACIYYGESKGYTDTETHQKTNNWLKSLKERYTWKPSDEQLKALEGCVDYLNESDNEDLLVMESLLEQLKAL